MAALCVVPHLVRAEDHELVRNLDDGTVIVQHIGEDGRINREEVILSNGRHKTTHFNQDGDPLYAVVATATGSFGMMYYDQADSPVFKFWDHGTRGYRVQAYSTTLEEIGAIDIQTRNGERTVSWDAQDRGIRTDRRAIVLIAALAIGILLGLAGGYWIGSRR